MKKLIYILPLLIAVINSSAQEQTTDEKIDTAYYERYPYKISVGPMLLKKNSVYALRSKESDFPLKYSTNSATRLGLTFGYDWLTLSGSVGLGTLDPDYRKEKGKTKSINFQMSINAQSVLGDLHFQSNKGMYLRGERDNPAFGNDLYYVRPDIRSQIFGATIRKALNGDKFSIKAPFVYDSWQKKSAGSVMIGGEFIYGNAKGDSSFVPASLSPNFPNNEVNYMRYIMFGPTLAYGHIFVIKQHFFITGVASVNGDLAQTTEKTINNNQTSRWYFSPNINLRGAMGYNSEKWELVASVISNRFFVGASEKNTSYQNVNDQFRLVYVRRINSGKLVPAVWNWGRKVVEKLGFGFLI